MASSDFHRQSCVTCFVVLLVSSVIAITSHKEKHPPGDSKGTQLLQWGVKLNMNDFINSDASKEERNDIADIVAAGLGLKNDGNVGGLTNIYLFSHAYHKNNTQDRLRRDATDHERLKHKNPEAHHIDPKKMDDLMYRAYKKQNDGKISRKEYLKIRDEIHKKFHDDSAVEWFEPQVILKRSPRRIKAVIEPHVPTFKDPYYVKQWHLLNRKYPGRDINVTGVWAYNATGHGVTVCIIDDGVQWNSPDIQANYNAAGSRDLNDNDDDPMPHAWKSNNNHGTRCAGEIAAVPNSVCSVGVAYNARVSGIRALDGPITDRLEAAAFTTKLQVNDVFSMSWGPDDDGKTVDGPHTMAKAAIVKGIETGRRGYGSIYVVASGNGGRYIDNCNFDGYANSHYTVTIGAVGENLATPFYAEPCSAMHAITFSSGSWGTRRIVTTDWTLRGGIGCTESHSGTSAAAPIGAGMIALILSVRPCLTWRDVQHLIILTSYKVDVKGADWATNSAGLHHSHQHGFGLMDAWRLVNAAKIWPLVPFLTSFTTQDLKVNAKIQKYPLIYSTTHTITKKMLNGLNLFSLEHVFVSITATHKRRGYMEFKLKCPSGMVSIIAATRALDASTKGLNDWAVSTVRCWGESPLGTYTIIATDRGALDGPVLPEGTFVKWRLTLFGSSVTPEAYKERIRKVHASFSGYPLQTNTTIACPPPPPLTDNGSPMAEKTLKTSGRLDSSGFQSPSGAPSLTRSRILLLASVLCVVMAAYETFEYMCCYRDEKRESKEYLQLQQRARRMARNGRNGGPINNGENQGLLDTAAEDEEDIALETFRINRQPRNKNNSATERQNLEIAKHDTVPYAGGANNYPASNSSNIPQDILNKLSTEEIALNMNTPGDAKTRLSIKPGASNIGPAQFSKPQGGASNFPASNSPRNGVSNKPVATNSSVGSEPASHGPSSNIDLVETNDDDELFSRIRDS
ncbi:proprotein convertase subtilisin/kexin type 7-like isoform X2 [Lineus longissimus]|uniref:proprotein convertase subtilisin/kexin type 7-like isoform X2 n=1 Tax=Lineus longissimus TaxID=88925 RepID=UPI00315C5517